MTIGRSFGLGERRPFWRRRRWWVVVGILGVLIASLVIQISYRSVRQEGFRNHVGELRGPMEVGQVFVSPTSCLRGVAVHVGTFADRVNTEDIIFELRSSPLSAEVMRSVRLNARALHDHDWAEFRFAPLCGPRGRVLYLGFTSPNSSAGNAVTLFFGHGNPYRVSPESSLYIFRNGRNGSSAEQAGKKDADLAFRVESNVTVAERVIRAGPEALAYFRSHKREARDAFPMLGLSLATSATLFWGIPWLRRSPRSWQVAGVLALFGIGIWIRYLAASRLPFTNDEGTAMVDAWTALQGRLPGGDGVLKTPVFVGVLGGALAVLGHPIWAGRVVSSVFSLATVIFLARLAGRLRFNERPRTRSVTAVLWLAAAAPAVFGVYAHAQPLQLLMATATLMLFLIGLQRSDWRGASIGALAGVTAALAFGIRKTALALVIPMLVAYVLVPAGWKVRSRNALFALLGAIVTLSLLVGVEAGLYGLPGVKYFLGFSIANIDPASTASAEERQVAFVQGVLPMFREALPLLFLALITLGVFLQDLLRVIRCRPWQTRLAFIVPALLAWQVQRFVLDNERAEHLIFGVGFWWRALPLLFLCPVFFPLFAEKSEHVSRLTDFWRSRLFSLLVPLGWIGAVAFLYASWIKFTANYLAEFLPALVLLAAEGVWMIRQRVRRPALLAALALVLAGTLYSSARSAFAFPHTGTFTRAALVEAAMYLQQHVPAKEPILTAATLVPFVSGHRVLNDIAHPTHYAYGYIEPHVRNIYMVPSERMAQDVMTKVNWVILDRLTVFSYFREYPDIEKYVTDNFAEVAEIENGSNPLRILRKVEGGTSHVP